MHALLNWAIALSDVRTLFYDNSLIALHSFPFTQKLKNHSSLLSVRSIYKSDVPSSGILTYLLSGTGLVPASAFFFIPEKDWTDADRVN